MGKGLESGEEPMWKVWFKYEKNVKSRSLGLPWEAIINLEIKTPEI